MDLKAHWDRDLLEYLQNLEALASQFHQLDPKVLEYLGLQQVQTALVDQLAQEFQVDLHYLYHLVDQWILLDQVVLSDLENRVAQRDLEDPFHLDSQMSQDYPCHPLPQMSLENLGFLQVRSFLGNLEVL